MIGQFTGGPTLRPGSRLSRMTITQQRSDASVPSAWRRMWLWAVAHGSRGALLALLIVPLALLCGTLLRDPD
jgi:hypothetical protein